MAIPPCQGHSWRRIQVPGDNGLVRENIGQEERGLSLENVRSLCSYLLQMDLQSPDFYTHLSQSENFKENRAFDAQLAVIAGSDTGALALSNICYLLCRHPEYQSRLFEEIAGLPDDDGLIDDNLLAALPLLLGTINESLRLYPPVPSGLQRLTPPEGAVIAGRYIPGNTVVTTPTYSLQRGLYLNNIMLS